VRGQEWCAEEALISMKMAQGKVTAFTVRVML